MVRLLSLVVRTLIGPFPVALQVDEHAQNHGGAHGGPGGGCDAGERPVHVLAVRHFLAGTGRPTGARGPRGAKASGILTVQKPSQEPGILLLGENFEIELSPIVRKGTLR